MFMFTGETKIRSAKAIQAAERRVRDGSKKTAMHISQMPDHNTAASG